MARLQIAPKTPNRPSSPNKQDRPANQTSSLPTPAKNNSLARRQVPMISILTFINGKLRRATVMLSHLGRHQSLFESSIANLLCLPHPTPLRLILHKSLFSNHINYIIQKEAKNHQLRRLLSPLPSRRCKNYNKINHKSY